MSEKPSNQEKSNYWHMPRVHKRKYEKIDEAEIDLVVQCQDSHEFYQKYRDRFPDKKKGIDSISKIWKRRGEFMKKRQILPDSSESSLGLSPELEILVTAQNRILSDFSVLMKEQLKVTREILERLPKQVQKMDDHVHKTSPSKSPEPKEPARKTIQEKPADIMIGS